jgi:hypothetical protein
VHRILVPFIAGLLVVACSHDNPPQTTPVIPANCNLPAPQPSSLPPGQVQELGTHSVGDNVSFTVPANTGSVSIVQQAVGKVPLEVVLSQSGGVVTDNSAVPLRLHFPDGGVAYDDFAAINPGTDGTIDPSTLYIEFSQDTPVAASLTFPNTATSLAVGVPAGTWSMVVGDFSYECTVGIGCSDGGTTADKYDVKILTRPLPPGTQLDVNFYIVGATTNPSSGAALTATTAPNDAAVKRMISTYTSYYAQVGITVRNVNFIDVTATQRSEFAHIALTADTGQGPCDQLDQMFTISSGQSGSTMNVFLVNDINDSSQQGGGTTVGIDGTIPGPATFAGTVHSGAAVSMADLYFGFFSGGCPAKPSIVSCGPDIVAYIAAHETGHFLGLFHTTEMNGDLVDPLNDTAKCPCTVCAPNTTTCGKTDGTAPILSTLDCSGGKAGACAGADNLMFWSFDDTGLSQGHLTVQQGQVMSLNPVVQ